MCCIIHMIMQVNLVVAAVAGVSSTVLLLLLLLFSILQICRKKANTK